MEWTLARHTDWRQGSKETVTRRLEKSSVPVMKRPLGKPRFHSEIEPRQNAFRTLLFASVRLNPSALCLNQFLPDTELDLHTGFGQFGQNDGLY